jgi:hypothetical protein
MLRRKLGGFDEEMAGGFGGVVAAGISGADGDYDRAVLGGWAGRWDDAAGGWE